MKGALCHNPGCVKPWIPATKKRSKCSRCMLIHYCSEACQHTHWNEHRKTCKSWSELSFMETAMTSSYNCPLTARYGKHQHGRIPFSKEHEAFYSLLDKIVVELQLDTRYRLKCNCIWTKYVNFSFVVSSGERIFVFLHCLTHKQSKIVLYLIKIDLEGEAYFAFPFQQVLKKNATEKLNGTLLNVSSKSMEENRFFVHVKEDTKKMKECPCEFKHFTTFAISH